MEFRGYIKRGVKMKIEDYSKYYIQGSDHYLIPRDEFEELFSKISKAKEESSINITEIIKADKIMARLDKLSKKYDKLLVNWEKLKEDLKLVIDYGSGDEASRWDKIYGEHAKSTLKTMQELEQGSDSNE